MLFVGSRFCPHCGAPAAERRALEGTKFACPRCRLTRPGAMMDVVEIGDVIIDECGACGGIWADHPTFTHICENANVRNEALRRLGTRKGQADEIVRYLKCPVCDEQMVRRNYARRSGVIVDFCVEHGLWFDRDELRRVVEFIQSGGLEEAAEAEQERLKAEAERKRVEVAADGKEPRGQVHGEDVPESKGMRVLGLILRALDSE
jgi:Zn-finger nucleic acid-binding protein